MPGGPLDALNGLRVLDISRGIGGSYCTKLLTDAGADVLKVEPPDGHPLRAWSYSSSVGLDGDPDGALFRYLAAGQHSVAVDLGVAAGRDHLLDLATISDVVVEDLSSELDATATDDMVSANPALTVASITPFGTTGPRAGQHRSDFLLQALSGSMYNHGTDDREPLLVGGQLGEWIAGAYAAAGVLAARAGTERSGRGQHVDVSVLESLAVTLVSYPSVAASMAPTPVRRRATYDMIPGVEPCADGHVGLTTLTAQQWHDFVAMIGHPALAEDRALDHPRGRAKRRDELLPLIHGWTEKRTGIDIVERAAEFRVPAAPVLSGQTVLELDHLVARQLFDRNPRGGFPHPRPPFRSSATSPKSPPAAPRLNEHDPSLLTRAPRPNTLQSEGTDPDLPLAGVRVLDLTAFWAGPSATQYLATLGADVIKVESVQRPDAIRFSTLVPPTTEQWYEQSFLFNSANLNKRGITLNLSDPAGRGIALDLVARADVVVENFSPRVMEGFGLGYDELAQVRPDIIAVRMPGWGLAGPWRERPAFATTMEQAAGMAWVTGYEGGAPLAPGLCDPLAGIHAAFAVLAALEQRRATGRGQEIELSMVDLAVNVAVEPILEHAVYGNVMTRTGNRSPRAVPQGVYACSGKESWVALSVTGDQEWKALTQAIGAPSWAEEPALGSGEGRHDAADMIDSELSDWCASRSAEDIVAVLAAAGVPTEPVVPAWAIDQDEQMQSRGFWEAVDHPVAGTHRYPGSPAKLSDRPTGWYRSPAPLLGQHTEQILTEDLGFTPEALAVLRDAHIIGDRPLGL